MLLLRGSEWEGDSGYIHFFGKYDAYQNSFKCRAPCFCRQLVAKRVLKHWETQFSMTVTSFESDILTELICLLTKTIECFVIVHHLLVHFWLCLLYAKHSCIFVSLKQYVCLPTQHISVLSFPPISLFLRSGPTCEALPETKCQPSVFHLCLHCYAQVSWRLSLKSREITHRGSDINPLWS